MASRTLFITPKPEPVKRIKGKAKPPLVIEKHEFEAGDRVTYTGLRLRIKGMRGFHFEPLGVYQINKVVKTGVKITSVSGYSSSVINAGFMELVEKNAPKQRVKKIRKRPVKAQYEAEQEPEEPITANDVFQLLLSLVIWSGALLMARAGFMWIEKHMPNDKNLVIGYALATLMGFIWGFFPGWLAKELYPKAFVRLLSGPRIVLKAIGNFLDGYIFIGRNMWMLYLAITAGVIYFIYRVIL